MADSGWTGIIVRPVEGVEAYRAILAGLEIERVIEETASLSEESARKIGQIARSVEKPLILSEHHHMITYATSGEDVVLFDAHSDDSPYGGQAAPLIVSNFLNKMPGKHYVAGVSTPSGGRDAVKIHDYNIEEILSQPIGSPFFLSYCVDVFKGFNGHVYGDVGTISIDRARELTLGLLKERKLSGLNVSSYSPDYDPGHTLVEKIVSLLKPLVEMS